MVSRNKSEDGKKGKRQRKWKKDRTKDNIKMTQTTAVSCQLNSKPTSLNLSELEQSELAISLRSFFVSWCLYRLG